MEHIEKGKLMPLEAIFKGLDLEYEPTSRIFDLGFRLSEDEREVIAVDKNSEAYNAGLRKGHLVVSSSIYYGSTTKPIKLTVRTKNNEKAISYYPVKEAEIPQLKNLEHNKTIFRL